MSQTSAKAANDLTSALWYGLHRKVFTDTLIVFAVIGALAALLALLAARFGPARVSSPWAPLILLLFIPGLWLTVAAVLSTTWLRVLPDRLEWYLWKRVLLGTYPVSTLRGLRAGTWSAVRITTTRGTTFLLGLHLRDRERLAAHLVEVLA
jgi:hypothetical protein